MLSKKTWYILAALVAVFGLWRAVETSEFVYSERWVDGVVVESKVVCGNAFANVFLSEYDDSVLGPATAADCSRLGRTRVVEVAGFAAVAGFLLWFGRTHGKEPPRPIDEELPRLPPTDREVEGRRRHSPTG